jgi:tetratricopeptide (TPR) repeat protein
MCFAPALFVRWTQRTRTISKLKDRKYDLFVGNTQVPDGFARWHRYRALLPRCDRVVCAGDDAARLRRLGYDCIHVPSRWNETLPQVEDAVTASPRDVDVLFAGDVHAARQRQRLPWLGRLARLSPRRRVHFHTTATEPDEALLRRARLWFHRGGGAVGLQRLERAAALGAAPLLSADDAAVDSYWRHGYNCLRYTADNLEALVEHYLDHEEQRLQVARAAAATVAAPGFWSELFAVLQRDRDLLAQRAAGRHAWDAQHELLARAWQALETAGVADATLTADLDAACVHAAEPAPLRLALGLATAARGEHAAAATHFQQAAEAEPPHVLAGLYFAEALARAGRGQDAVAQARRTLALLDGWEQGELPFLDAPPYPPGGDVFAVEWERAAWDHAGAVEDERRAKQTLLRWRLHGLLARQTGDLTQRYEAALAHPDLPATRATLGSALRQADRHLDAAHHLRQALAANPFDAAAARLLYDTLNLLGQEAERQRLAAARRLLHQVAPQAVVAESWFLAAPARPLLGPPPRLSLCSIVKDEEANLPHCLASVAELVQEIVVVDTGSTDATKEVARRFGAKVYDFAWCDSFAAARNETLRHATGDWIFFLDADDSVDEDNRRKLRALFAGLGDELAAYLMRQHSWPDAVGGATLVVDQAKLFRRDPRLRWEYRVHEQILPSLLRLGGVARTTDIVFHHSGYQDPRLRRRKLERNRRLLLLDQAERPDDPLTLFNLGTLHLDLGQFAEAAAFLQRSLDRAPAGYSLLPRLHGLLTCGLHRLGREQEALAACRRGRAAYPDEGDLLFWEAQLLGETGAEAEAEANWRRLLSLPPGPALACLDPGSHGYKSRHALASLCRRQGRVAEAESLWREAVAERPDFVPGWLGLTELYLSVNREAELMADVARLEAAAATREAAAVVRARLHLARRELAAARTLLEEAVRSSPHLLWARLLLGQALAREGGDRVAALQVLREVLALDPHQPEARRLLAQLEQSGESAG